MTNNELPLPESVLQAKRSMEMARIWIVDNRPVVSLTPNLWSDPGNWGAMLVDLAKHLSKQYVEAGWVEKDALARIRAAFDAEWSAPTDEVEAGTRSE